MSSDFRSLLSRRTAVMQHNALRQILKAVSQPGMVSLAGGIPAPQSFPLEEMYQLNETVLDQYGAAALQYDVTEGFAPFREALAGWLLAGGIDVSADEIMVFNGSQSTLDMIAKILISPGDIIALESPSYLGAISAFNAYEPTYMSIETDEGGILPAALDRLLHQHSVKFIYLVPTFQNPTGRTLSIERRRQIADIVRRHDALVIEDDPYSALRYRGEEVAPLYTLAPQHTVYLSTLSKTFAPGLRLGFCIAPPLIHQWLTIAKQGADLHTNTYAQALAAAYIEGGYIQRQIPKIIELYRPRQEAMFQAMARYFPAGWRWIEPEGGMFVWVEGPAGADAEQLYWQAVERKVAFVPGKYFYIQPGEGQATMRLNFTRIDEEGIVRAIGILGQVIQDSSQQRSDK